MTARRRLLPRRLLPRRARPWVRGLMLLVMAGAVVVGIAVQRQRQAAVTRSAVITAPAEDLGPGAQRLLPGLRDAVVVVPDRPHAPEEARDPARAARIHRTRSFTVSTNRLGLRGPEVALPAPGRRILCVGDSVTFGWGVADDQTWPALLQRALGVETLNGGVPAQRPRAIAAWAAQNAAKLDVDLVLFARRPDQRVPDPLADYAATIHDLAAALRPIPLGVILPPVSTFDPGADPAQEAAALAQALRPVPVLELTPAFRAAQRAPGVILVQEQGRQRMLRLPDQTEVVAADAPERGLAPAITDAFEDDPTLQEPLFFDGGHPDADGFDLFAAEVAAWVRAQGWEGDPLVIPAVVPTWLQDPPAFVGDPSFYGEASWNDVRGRVLQHQATVLRDRARYLAQSGDLAAAATRYAEAEAWLRAHPVHGGVGARLHALYLEALARDAALTRALADGASPPLPPAGLARLRARLLAGADGPTLAREASSLRLDALDPQIFTDFADRHALRLRLVAAALDAADPFALPDTWGLWDPASRAAERDAILASAEGPDALPRYARPAAHRARSAARFTVEGLGALPTGDSWVDVAGEPGPGPIGTLAVLSLDDPAQRARLEQAAAQLNAALTEGPARVPGALAPLLAFYDAQPTTSRYYNRKQAVNEAIRQLARAGAWAQAADLVAGLFPLHHQDYAAPNRAGVLYGIEGRLLALAGADPEPAWARALEAGDAFWAQIAAADAPPR